ncbi:hypothetical protein NSK_002036 [Nannochloropsis salina CCMP1776]|uniref:Uncharacterized protein n=1 Tax=Nannochloropsis salina CCMP1776 TaxID=1027361 RepID=A0A4D9DE80_9STRA|nr:hypothetical protein NSK_002036 [Nannochloropsis salina CCMP1776]|eukprot:TFJ86949.1 hypothetical protein NSK_002036 [Nannochloropsis salina CCMP1776]
MDEAELNLGATLSASRDMHTKDEKEALLLLLSLPSVANVRVPDERDNTKRKPGPPPRYFPITSFPSTAHVPSGRQCGIHPFLPPANRSPTFPGSNGGEPSDECSISSLSSGGTINSMDVDVSCALPQEVASKRWMSQSVSAVVWDDEDGGETDQVPMTSEDDDDEEEEDEEEGEGWGEEEEEMGGEKKETYSSPLRSGHVAQRREGTGREDAEGEVLPPVGAGEEEEEEEEEGREDEEVVMVKADGSCLLLSDSPWTRQSRRREREGTSLPSSPSLPPSLLHGPPLECGGQRVERQKEDGLLPTTMMAALELRGHKEGVLVTEVGREGEGEQRRGRGGGGSRSGFSTAPFLLTRQRVDSHGTFPPLLSSLPPALPPSPVQVTYPYLIVHANPVVVSPPSSGYFFATHGWAWGRAHGSLKVGGEEEEGELGGQARVGGVWSQREGRWRSLLFFVCRLHRVFAHPFLKALPPVCALDCLRLPGADGGSVFRAGDEGRWRARVCAGMR